MNTHPLIAWMQAVNDTLVDHLDRGDRRLVELGQQLTAFAATQAPAVTPDRCLKRNPRRRRTARTAGWRHLMMTARTFDQSRLWASLTRSSRRMRTGLT